MAPGFPENPSCRYCQGPIKRSTKTPTLWNCPGCGMFQTVPGDPKLGVR